jgi:hypothetical protein
LLAAESRAVDFDLVVICSFKGCLLSESFVAKKALLFGDENSDLVANVIVMVGNQSRLIERAHESSG